MKQAQNEEMDIGIAGMRKLIETVKTVHGFDLGIYASTFLKRRVSRIIQLHDMQSVEDLIEKLEDRAFFPTFIKKLTVEGTELFRDPGFWRYFRDEICPGLSRNHSRIKIWIPGCSTGEEVVSMAITLTEAGIYDKCLIIATDLNSDILSGSQTHIFPHSKLEISENNYKRFQEDESSELKKYIEITPQGFTVQPTLFRNINYEIFNDNENLKVRGVHVVLSRNYFIYFTAQYQERLLKLYTEGLMSNGYLAIGNMENISFCKDTARYTLVNEKEKIYRKQA